MTFKDENHPHFGKEPETISPQISIHLTFLHGNTNGFQQMSRKRQRTIEKSFAGHFQVLSPDRQLGVRHTLNGIASDIHNLSAVNPGIAIVQGKVIADRIVDTLEGCGMVESGMEGGIQTIHNDLSRVMPQVIGVLDYYKDSIGKTVQGTRQKGVRDTGERLLSLEESIRQELDRLQLTTDVKAIPISTEGKYLPPALSILSHTVELNDITYGLIGFTTLIRLIQEFFSTMKYARIAEAWSDA